MVASILNLNQNGSPLTFPAAMAGPDKAAWELEAVKAIRKLITGTSTIKPIHKHNVPDSRRGGIAY
jgi:hypothetical protein